MSILYEKRGRIAILTINRPEAMNALDPETSQAMVEAWTDFRDDADLWVAIVTGAGDKAFCAGADLKRMNEFLTLSPVERYRLREQEPGLGGLPRHLPIWKPIIAAVNGHCLAGGLELALACDVRIAAEHARLGLAEVKWGIIPGQGGTQRLPRLIPVGKALEMILTAEPIDAQEALQLGLVNNVVSLRDLMPTAMALAEKICANAPLAVRAAKEAVWRGLDLPLEEGLRLEQFLANLVRDTEDVQEGMKAFAEKRKPQFRGR